MGTKYEIRYKLPNGEIVTDRVMSFWSFLKLRIKHRGKICYYTVRP